MKVLGRIVARDGVAGLFIPYKSQENLLDGIYEVREILGELTLRYVGKANLQEDQPERFYSVGINDLFDDRSRTFLTTEEIDNA